MIVTSVSEFCDSMSYCEMRIKHFLKGIKPPQTEITIEGTKAHEEELKFNPKPKNMQSLCTKLRDFRDIRVYRELVCLGLKGKDLSVLMLIGNDSER